MKRQPKRHAPRPARLFAEPARPADAHVAQIDGASRGNPGPAAYAVIIRRPDGHVVFQLGKYLGRATNNVAEYFALITALGYAASHGLAKLRVRSDSELLVRQMQGHYKVKSASLHPLHERALKLARGLASFSVEHVPRGENREADALANAALDRTGAQRAVTSHRQPAAQNQKAKGETRTIRARYSAGALHPVEPLDLEEGAEVEITMHRTATGPPRHRAGN